jgi:gliding motility-associated-like protein
LYQWDLCAGSATAIVASIYSVSISGFIGSMQLAPDGKIYCSKGSTGNLDVINSPNSLGAACAYSVSGQSVSPKLSLYSLPNFMSSSLLQRPPPTPFTHTVSNTYGCQSALFNSTYNPSITVVGCSASGYSLTGLQWNFGDPASGSANTSTLVSPVHAFTTLGTYSVNLILYYSCGGGTDTLKQVVNINQPCISVSSTSITCSNLGSATVAATGGIGPFSYTWMPSAQTSSVATGLSPGTYTLTVFDFGTNFTYTATTLFTSLVPLTGNLNNSSSITCNGANTATASVTNLAGGSGSVNYLWWSTSGSYTTATPLLSAGLWSVQVTDALTGCQINQSFYITQPPAMNLVLSSNSPTTCAGTSFTLSGINSGGTPYLSGPAYTYSWIAGPATDTRVVSQTLAGTYVYTLISKDSYSCSITNTIALDYIPNPVLSVSNVSICPLQVGTLSVSGASSYTWTSATVSLTGNTFTDNPLISKQYTIEGSALSCSSIVTASIILKPLPVPLLNSNGPVCNGLNLLLFGNVLGNGAASYTWTGPQSFTSIQQYPVINQAAPVNSGVYNFTVSSAATNCTASTSGSLTVNPTPTVSAQGSTVCVNQVLTLSANSFSGSTYFWKGPNSYTSSLQNPFINSPPVGSSGIYTVRATSAAGCTNSAVADVTVTPLPLPLILSNSPKCSGSTLNFSGTGGTSYSWAGPNVFNSLFQNPTLTNVTVPAGGTYTLTVTTGPCVNSATHAVIVHPLPSFTMASNSPVCETKTLSLMAGSVNNATVYLWKGPANFNSQFQNPQIAAVTQTYSGVYTLTVIDSNSCQNSFSTAVMINQNPDVSTSSATVCLNQPATLTANGAVTYTWSGPGFYVSYQPEAFISKANSSVTTIYTVVGTAANTCTSITTGSLMTLSLPLPSLSAEPSNKICINKEITLEGFGGYLYDWNGPDNFIYSGKVLTFTATNTSYAGTYALTVTDNKGCTSNTTTIVKLDVLPTGNLVGTKMEGCVPFRSDFKFETDPLSYSSITTNWQINNGVLIEGKKFSADFTQAGDYRIKGRFLDTLTKCVNTAEFFVSVYPLPIADFTFSPEKPIENTEDVFFINTSEGEQINKWNWFFVSNTGGNSSQKNTSYFFKDAGIYPVTLVVKNKWGCADTVVKAIKIENDFTIFVPNAFTPNGDDKNEVFLPILSGTKLYELSIFNRWGTKVFHSTNTYSGWDGDYNGEPCKDDVYVWKIKLSTLSGEMKERTGHVTLYR